MRRHLVRPATPADAEPAARLCSESMAETYGHFLPAEAMRPWLEGGLTDTYVRENIGRMLVAEAGEAVVGVCVLRNDLVDLLWVGRDHRGRGIGGALMNEAEARIRAAGHAGARVECFSRNTNAVAFYEAQGYRTIRSFHDPEAGTEKIELQKTLSP
jgi:ribosomal protein S18 acetylase RimI-like enzyme